MSRKTAASGSLEEKNRVCRVNIYLFEFLFGYINHLEPEKNLWCSPLI